MFEIRKPLSKTTAFMVSMFSLITFFLSWSVLSYGGYVPVLILPTPDSVIKAVPYLHFHQGLVWSTIVSFYRVMAGFSLTILFAIPLGILAGTFPIIKAVIQPFMNPLRYLPIAAVVPLFVVWFGIDETMKVMVLFVGTFVYLLPLIIEVVEQLDQVYLDTAYTLGANRWQILTQIIAPGVMPSVFEAIRVISGVGWTYVILAEIINAKYGLGHLISTSARRSHTEQVIAVVLLILVIGIITDRFFLWTSKTLFPWQED